MPLPKSSTAFALAEDAINNAALTMGALALDHQVNARRDSVGLRIADVLLSGNESKVVRVGADTIPTLMIQFKSVRHRAAQMLIDNSVNHHKLHGHADLTIVAGAPPSWPVPASGG